MQMSIDTRMRFRECRFFSQVSHIENFNSETYQRHLLQSELHTATMVDCCRRCFRSRYSFFCCCYSMRN